MTARDDILQSITSGLTGVRPLDLPAPREPQPSALDADEQIERFRSLLEGVGGTCEQLASASDVTAAIRARLEPGSRAVLSDAQELAQLPQELPQVDFCTDPADREQLLAADWGISCVQWAVAETGTLVLLSDSERHRYVSLVPTRHLAILPADRIVPDLSHALARVQTSAADGLSRTISLITGPSRTADIELSLVIGVHGPRELHVLIVPPA